VPGRFGYNTRSHSGDHFLHRHGFLAGGSYTHFEPRHFDGPGFPCRGSCPTGSNGEVQKDCEDLLRSCHTPVLRNRTEASIRVPRMFKSHAW
jgi:hypothetical protein